MKSKKKTARAFLVFIVAAHLLAVGMVAYVIYQGDNQTASIENKVASGKMSNSEPLTFEEWRQIKAEE